MINVPWQDDLCAHGLLPKSLCLFYDLLFAYDNWFYLKISEGLKHFTFLSCQELKKQKEEKDGKKTQKKEKICPESQLKLSN
jgi:hypothetical protein